MTTSIATLGAYAVDDFPGRLARPKAFRNSLTMGWRALLSARHEPELMADAIAILAMGYHPAGGAAGVALAVLLILIFGFSVSWIWTTLGLVLWSVQAVSILSFAVQFPLTFASNVYVNPDTMPGWLRAFVRANPVSHLVTAERALMSGTATAGQVGWALLASAALVAVFAPLTMTLYRSGR